MTMRPGLDEKPMTGRVKAGEAELGTFTFDSPGWKTLIYLLPATRKGEEPPETTGAGHRGRRGLAAFGDLPRQRRHPRPRHRGAPDQDLLAAAQRSGRSSPISLRSRAASASNMAMTSAAAGVSGSGSGRPEALV